MSERISTDDLRYFIVDNGRYYLNKRRVMPRNGFVSVNLSALFFHGFWAIYRRMYLYGIATLTICTISIIVFPIMTAPVVIVAMIFWGLFGNRIYISQCEKQYTDLEVKRKQFTGTRLGGVDIRAVVIAVITAIFAFVVGLMMIQIRVNSNAIQNKAAITNSADALLK